MWTPLSADISRTSRSARPRLWTSSPLMSISSVERAGDLVQSTEQTWNGAWKVYLLDWQLWPVVTNSPSLWCTVVSTGMLISEVSPQCRECWSQFQDLLGSFRKYLYLLIKDNISASPRDPYQSDVIIKTVMELYMALNSSVSECLSLTHQFPSLQ